MVNNFINQESLAKASKTLMLKQPFYGLFLMSLNKIWDTEISTIGVGLNGLSYELIINPIYWNTLTPNQQEGVLTHELMHIGFFHLTDYKDYTEKDILNTAMDLEINQYINKGNLPKNGCYIEDFTHLNLTLKAGTNYYYKKLLTARDQNDDFLIDLLTGHGETSDGKPISLPKHNWSSEIEALDEATCKVLSEQTKHILIQVADQVKKGRGTIPGEFTEILKRLTTIVPTKFDWKGYVKRFIGRSTKTFTVKSRRKLNKRLEGFPGLKLRKKQHILAAIDTSASVNNTELIEFLNELCHLVRIGVEVTICEFDTKIQKIQKYNSKKDLEIYGRGGTNFQEPVDYFNVNKHKYSCLIFLTDGEALPPINVTGHILWVLSSRSKMNETLPGEKIKIEL